MRLVASLSEGCSHQMISDDKKNIELNLQLAKVKHGMSQKTSNLAS